MSRSEFMNALSSLPSHCVFICFFLNFAVYDGEGFVDIMVVCLFRQNTYLQNKKHTLTCQGGTGCYRFNYQPGS